jgi:hypothetical protein
MTYHRRKLEMWLLSSQYRRLVISWSDEDGRYRGWLMFGGRIISTCTGPTIAAICRDLAIKVERGEAKC